jgi:hypothetical protein
MADAADATSHVRPPPQQHGQRRGIGISPPEPLDKFQYFPFPAIITLKVVSRDTASSRTNLYHGSTFGETASLPTPL